MISILAKAKKTNSHTNQFFPNIFHMPEFVFFVAKNMVFELSVFVGGCCWSCCVIINWFKPDMRPHPQPRAGERATNFVVQTSRSVFSLLLLLLGRSRAIRLGSNPIWSSWFFFRGRIRYFSYEMSYKPGGVGDPRRQHKCHHMYMVDFTEFKCCELTAAFGLRM